MVAANPRYAQHLNGMNRVRHHQGQMGDAVHHRQMKQPGAGHHGQMRRRALSHHG